MQVAVANPGGGQRGNLPPLPLPKLSPGSATGR